MVHQAKGRDPKAERCILKAMEEKIDREGRVLSDRVLDVGRFLNQQIDTVFLEEIGEEIGRLYRDAGVTKILTIESSGIALAVAAGIKMKVPVVFAKKHRTSNVGGPVYATTVHSFTHDFDYTVCVAQEYLSQEDTVLIVDDFLANGKAAEGLIALIHQAGAGLAGVAVAVEKGFQGGGDRLRATGVRVEALAGIASMSPAGICYRPCRGTASERSGDEARSL